MAVIINEFEIVTEPTPDTGQTAPEQQSQNRQPNVLPQEVVGILQVHTQRMMRVRAD